MELDRVSRTSSIPSDLSQQGQNRTTANNYQPTSISSSECGSNKSSRGDGGRTLSDVEFNGVERLPDAGEEYGDAIELQKMLIDERIKSQKHQTNYETLCEEYNRLESEIQLINRAPLGRTNETKNEISDEEKAEIHRLRQELQSTRIHLEEVEAEKREIPPAELEYVRATVIHENHHKPNFANLESLEIEIEKYRGLFNDIRSKFTILSADHQHMKMEHCDEIDGLKFRMDVKFNELQREVQHYKQVNIELKKCANVEIEEVKSENVRLSQKINSIKIEKEQIEENRLKYLKETDKIVANVNEQISQSEIAVQQLKNEENRLNSLLELRQEELTNMEVDLKNAKNDAENVRNENSSLKRQILEEKEIFKNCEKKLRLKLEKEINSTKHESEKYKIGYRKVCMERDQANKNAEKRGKTAEMAQHEAVAKIDEVKREQWAIIERIKAEKRDSDEKLAVETERAKKAENERDMSLEANRVAEMESERNKSRFLQQIEAIKDERSKISNELFEAKRNNEQNEELKRAFDAEHTESVDLRRQVEQRDVGLREMMVSKNGLNDEISNLRRELQLSLDEAERTKEHEKIKLMEEKNRLNLRIDQLDIKNNILQENNQKRSSECDQLKKKFNNKLKIINEENNLLRAEKEKLKNEVEVTKIRSGVSKEEYDRVKRKMEMMRKRLGQFAQAMYSSETLVQPSNSNLSLSLSPVKSEMSLLAQNVLDSSRSLKAMQLHPSELSLLTQRLDQMEVEQTRQAKIFKHQKDKNRISE